MSELHPDDVIENREPALEFIVANAMCIRPVPVPVRCDQHPAPTHRHFDFVVTPERTRRFNQGYVVVSDPVTTVVITALDDKRWSERYYRMPDGSGLWYYCEPSLFYPSLVDGIIRTVTGDCTGEKTTPVNVGDLLVKHERTGKIECIAPDRFWLLYDFKSITTRFWRGL